jgi:hypothetical protein
VATAVGDLTVAVVSLVIEANKTSCFNDYEKFPKTVSAIGNITIKHARPALRSSVHLAPGTKPKAAAAFCSSAGLLNAGFPKRIADRKYKTLAVSNSLHKSMLSEAAMRVASRQVEAERGSARPLPAPPSEASCTAVSLASAIH